MSKSRCDKLSDAKIQQLLAAVGARSQDDPGSDNDAPDFDWRRPRYFNLAQLAAVGQFVEAAADGCREVFSRLYQGGCTVSVVSAEQHFSSALDAAETATDYYFSFGSDLQKPFGMLRIPHRSALLWTGLMLGSSGTDESADRPLSRLEESFLADIAAGLIAAFSRVYGSDLKPAREAERSLIALQGSDELLEIVFEAGKADSQEPAATAAFLVCCDKLEPVAGKTTSGHEKLSESQLRSVLLEHIHQVPMSVRVELGTAMLAFKDVINLQADDIVILNKKVSDPVNVLVEDRVLFRGYPAQSGGKQAVFIV